MCCQQHIHVIYFIAKAQDFSMNRMYCEHYMLTIQISTADDPSLQLRLRKYSQISKENATSLWFVDQPLIWGGPT